MAKRASADHQVHSGILVSIIKLFLFFILAIDKLAVTTKDQGLCYSINCFKVKYFLQKIAPSKFLEKGENHACELLSCFIACIIVLGKHPKMKKKRASHRISNRKVNISCVILF